MAISTPEQTSQVLMFTPADIDPNAHSINSAPLAFDISKDVNGRFYVDSVRINGECAVTHQDFGSFPDALEECAKRMRTQSHVKYTVEAWI